jgi:predicted acylesterase/phospholipase RssA
MPTAIVLSGGGSRGDFEIGAVRCLYDRGVTPSILCGTSVGAINAAKLAEGENVANPAQGLTGLEAIWFSLMRNTDMYLEEAWLRHPDMDPRVADLLRGTSATLTVNPPAHDSTWGFFSDMAYLIQGLSFLVSEGQPILKSLAVIVNEARGLYSLSPIMGRMQSGFDPTLLAAWAAAGGKLRLAIVALESGRLRYVTETGRVIERDGGDVLDLDTPPADCTTLAQSLRSLETEIAQLQSERQTLQAELGRAAPGEKPAIAAQIRALNKQIGDKGLAARQVSAQLEACIRAHPTPPLRLIDLRPGILASASIPGIFLPVRLGRESYVDGGIREVIPLQAAVDLGATQIFAVHSSSRTVVPFQTPARAGVLAITARSLKDLAIDEIDLNDRNVVIPPGASAPTIVHIEPEEDLHDITVIDPGLIRVCRDYGYMRAADAYDGAQVTDDRKRLATAIALLRRDTWRLENRHAGQPDPTIPGQPAPPADPSLQATINQQKAQLAALIAARRAAPGGPQSMPADIDHWTTHPERHPWLGALVNAARFVSQSVPATIKQGATASVAVTMLNTGSSTWDTAGRYRLGSQTPADNTRWGVAKVWVPQTVRPGDQFTFTFSIQASAPGGAVFQWQMGQDGVEWFGDMTAPVTIAVTSLTEPPECATLRADIARLRDRIAVLNDSLTGDPRIDAPIRRQIAQLQRDVNTKVARATSLGCAL